MNLSRFLDPQKSNWQRLLDLLPDDWPEPAFRLKAVPRIRKMPGVENLLRALGLYRLSLPPLPEVCWRAQRQGWMALKALARPYHLL